MKLLLQCALVGAGGFLGAISRFLIALLFGRLPIAFPIGTFVINVTGCLLLGWFLTMSEVRTIISDNIRLAIATGFVGAYTTFSTYVFESNALIEHGSGIKAMLNLVGSVLVGLAAVRLGIYLGSR